MKFILREFIHLLSSRWPNKSIFFSLLIIKKKKCWRKKSKWKKLPSWQIIFLIWMEEHCLGAAGSFRKIQQSLYRTNSTKNVCDFPGTKHVSDPELTFSVAANFKGMQLQLYLYRNLPFFTFNYNYTCSCIPLSKIRPFLTLTISKFKPLLPQLSRSF